MGRLWLTGAEVDASCLDMATVKWSEWKPQGHRHTRDLLTVISVCMRQNTWPLCIHLLQHLQATANQRVGRLIYCVFTGDIYFWWVIMFLVLCRLDVQFSIYAPFRTMEALDFPTCIFTDQINDAQVLIALPSYHKGNHLPDAPYHIKSENGWGN